MKSLRRLSPFPWKRLQRLPASAIQSRPRPLPELQATFERLAGMVAGRFGLDAPRVLFERMEVFAREQLRELLPGQWYFALLFEPLSGRQGYLALDPWLCSMLAASARNEVDCLRGWWGQLMGLNGLAGAITALCLQELENLAEGFDFSGWRYGGLVPSTGELGRGAPPSRLFYATWWKINWPRRTAFAGWLEPEHSHPPTDRRPPTNHFLPLDLQICGRLELGSILLQADALATLRHGDVLLLDDGLECSLSFGELRFALKPHQRGFMIVEPKPIPGGVDMSEVNISTVRTTEMDAEKLSRLPVELRVEAGRVRLKLEQVISLKAGDVLAVSDKVLGPVDVMAGERLIARGELVDIEGRRGVRLLEVLLDWEQSHAGKA